MDSRRFNRQNLHWIITLQFILSIHLKSFTVLAINTFTNINPGSILYEERRAGVPQGFVQISDSIYQLKNFAPSPCGLSSDNSCKYIVSNQGANSIQVQISTL